MTTPHPPPPHTTPTLASSLPTARQFLTSLFNAISEIPLIGGRNSNHDESSDDEVDDPPPGGTGNHDGWGGGEGDDLNNLKRRRKMLSRRQRRLLLLQDDGGGQGVGSIPGPGAGNVFKQVPVSHRHLIITLHVLFPGLVLPALDLLDRGLVGRIILQDRMTVKKEKKKGTKLIKEEDRQGPSVGGDITTVRQNITTGTEKDEDCSGDDTANQTDGNRKQKEAQKGKENPAAASFYLVRSAQPTSHHHRRRRQQQDPRYESGGEEDYPAENNSNNLFPGGQRAYIVRLDAWNCTCAAFAFASFSDRPEGEDTTTTTTTATTAKVSSEQAASSSSGTGNVAAVNRGKEEENINITTISSITDQGLESEIQEENQELVNENEVDKMDIDLLPLLQTQEESEAHTNTTGGHKKGYDENENSLPANRQEEWSFGGMSLDTKNHGGGEGADSPPPPLCKHLLACLLAERWNEALGRYVVERQVSKEEMAGIVAEI